ncbi:MAG: FAD-binding oxidoreductase [Anaerolineaceae bacterium]|nr:FAD-binding oxidoreductase [Anaerolineaceae bacterium]
MKNFDVILVGGGFLGLSTAYHLSKAGSRVLVLDKGDLGGGTSSACSGRAQVCEGYLDPLNLMLIKEGIKRHETLEEELGMSYDWKRFGLFLIIRTEELWKRWEERCEILTKAGIPTEMVARAELEKAEPAMNTAGLLGAAYSLEGLLNPLLFTRAYAQAAERCGATILSHAKVTGMDVEGGRVRAVRTEQDTYGADTVAVMAGAWTPTVTRLAGVETPVRHTHAEALVTEPIPEIIHNTIELADFYEIIHGKQQAVAIGFGPVPNGTLVITEAVTMTDKLHAGVSHWGLSHLAVEIVKLFPCLAKTRVMRSWGRPTSFTPDEEPIIGWMPQVQNLFTATSMVETITAVPLVSEWMAMMIRGESPPVDMGRYSPARFSGGWSWHS